MSLDFSSVKELYIPEGKVVKIEDSNGNTIYEGVKHGSGTYTLPIRNRDKYGIEYGTGKAEIINAIATLEGVPTSQITLGNCQISVVFSQDYSNTSYKYELKNLAITYITSQAGGSSGTLVSANASTVHITKSYTSFAKTDDYIGNFFDTNDYLFKIFGTVDIYKIRKSDNLTKSYLNLEIGNTTSSGMNLVFHSSDTSQTYLKVEYTY